MCHYAGNGGLHSIYIPALDWVKRPHSDALEAHIKIQGQIDAEFIGTAVTHHLDNKSIDCFASPFTAHFAIQPSPIESRSHTMVIDTEFDSLQLLFGQILHPGPSL